MQAKGRMSIAAGMPGSEGITAKIIRLDTENRSIMIYPPLYIANLIHGCSRKLLEMSFRSLSLNSPRLVMRGRIFLFVYVELSRQDKCLIIYFPL